MGGKWTGSYNFKIQNPNVKSKFTNPLVLMSVGGTFDYLAGKVPRAPGWMRERGLEWLYRLVREPRRLKRQLRGASFFLEVLRDES